jgi:hypothetical protein
MKSHLTPRILRRHFSEQIRDGNFWASNWVYGSNGSNSEHPFVEKSYDADGNLSLESIYLNSNLIQQTRQKRTPSSRSLQIGNHQRDFVYQNNRIAQVSTQNVELSYTYGLNGALKSKNNQLRANTINFPVKCPFLEKISSQEIPFLLCTKLKAVYES